MLLCLYIWHTKAFTNRTKTVLMIIMTVVVMSTNILINGPHQDDIFDYPCAVCSALGDRKSDLAFDMGVGRD